MMLRIPEELRRYCNGQAELLVSGSTIRQVIDEACAQFPDLKARILNTDGILHAHLAVYLNNRAVSPAGRYDVPVSPDDIIDLDLIASGG